MYYVKYTKPRTIITMFGEITYTRTIYKDLLNNRNFCYVDEKLDIDKRIRYTNDVDCYVAEAYSDENSMIKILLDRYKDDYGKYPLNLVADAGYGSYNNYMYLLDNNINAYVKYNTYTKERQAKKI